MLQLICTVYIGSFLHVRLYTIHIYIIYNTLSISLLFNKLHGFILSLYAAEGPISYNLDFLRWVRIGWCCQRVSSDSIRALPG